VDLPWRTRDLGTTPNATGAKQRLPEWKHDIPTRYFATYEALENAFRERVAGLVPRYHAGTRVFWDDFQRLYSRSGVFAPENGEAYITSNPRDCLAFGTPFQVLQGAWLSASRPNAASPEDPGRVAERFGLSGHLHQSIRTLSGGETVRLALAKAHLMAGCAARLTVASPFSWLSLDHWHLFRELVDHYRSRGTALELFALDGEASTLAGEDGDEPAAVPLRFTWRLNALQLDLGSLIDRLHDRRVWVGVAPREETLASPCLLCGDNGQGKSLVAKTLAGALAYTGEARVEGPRGERRVRLLFQDVFNQSLMRSMPQLAPRGEDDGVAAAYDAIRDVIRHRAPLAGRTLSAFGERRHDAAPLSLLEMKILLTALRLVDHDGVLILDEPDWGLSRPDAVAFVAAVVRAAHDRGVPVILISHKPWWRNLARSIRRVSKQTVSSGADGCLFRIRIDADPGGPS